MPSKPLEFFKDFNAISRSFSLNSLIEFGKLDEPPSSMKVLT
jgi:hypothetical protein